MLGGFYALCVIVGVVALLGLLSGVGANDTLWAPIGIFCGVTSLFLIWQLRMIGFSLFACPMVYLLYLWVFHFPLVFLGSLFPALLDDLSSVTQGWTRSNSWYQAALFSLLCTTGFAAGAALSLRSGSRLNRTGQELAWHDDLIQLIGVIETAIGVAMILFGIIRSGGAAVFTQSYESHYDDLFGMGAFTFGIRFAAQGLVLVAVGVKRRSMTYVLVSQGLLTCAMLALGARTSALFPVLLLMVVLEKRQFRFPKWVMVGGPLLLLSVISFVGAARHEGVLNSATTTGIKASPVDALLELGGSLHTASLSIQWIESGDQLQLGGGYWVPFERVIGLAIPGIRRDIENDSRLFLMVLASRTSGLGGSVVGEAYYNFGLFGALLFFLPLGYFIGRLDRAKTPMSTAWLIAVLSPFLMQVRDSFIPVPATILIGIVPLLVIKLYQPTGKLRPAYADRLRGLRTVRAQIPDLKARRVR